MGIPKNEWNGLAVYNYVACGRWGGYMAFWSFYNKTTKDNEK
jgi:hypothetical protein